MRTCTAVEDPHYTTFDRVAMDSFFPCRYSIYLASYTTKIYCTCIQNTLAFLVIILYIAR